MQEDRGGSDEGNDEKKQIKLEMAEIVKLMLLTARDIWTT